MWRPELGDERLEETLDDIVITKEEVKEYLKELDATK